MPRFVRAVRSTERSVKYDRSPLTSPSSAPQAAALSLVLRDRCTMRAPKLDEQIVLRAVERLFSSRSLVHGRVLFTIRILHPQLGRVVSSLRRDALVAQHVRVVLVSHSP